jgi:E3 ubiquitin-protein ligase listerin
VTKKRIEVHLKEFAGTWAAGMFDRDRAVSKAAKDSVTSVLDTEEKLLKFWKKLQPQILEYARGALKETPQSLCDDRSMSADEIQETYFRVVGSSILLFICLLSQLDKADLLQQQDGYQDFFGDNSIKLWGLISCEDAFVRKSVAQLLVITLQKQHGVIEGSLELLSKKFISEALRVPQTMSAYQLVQALDAITAQYPEVWTVSHKVKKPALSKLQDFIVKGSQGGPAAYWQSLQSLLGHLPDGILPTEIDGSLDFLKALRDGINSREEPRSNAASAWSSYFHIADLLVKHLSDESSKGKLFQEAVFPVFEQYFHPSLENSKWSLGENTAAIAEAYNICASTTDAALRTSLDNEWQRLADDFISRLQTSLPEQSKDYEISQASVLAEGNRWFSLVNEVFILQPGGTVKEILENQSSKIIATALSTMTNRNGKAYSAAGTVDAALRTTPALFRIPANMDALWSFLDEHLSSLIISPSMKYLVSILRGLLFFPEQKPYFSKFWQSTVCSLLQLPKEQEPDQLRAITALIASRDVQALAEDNSGLQNLLYSVCVKALHGDKQAWPVMEAAVTFHTIATTPAKKVVNQIIPGIDIVNVYLEDALNALKLFGEKSNDLLQDHDVQVLLLTKLLALSEIRNNAQVSTRALILRGLVERSNEYSERTDASKAGIVSFLHEQIEAASPQSLL